MEPKIQAQSNISNSYNAKKCVVALVALILLVAVAILVWYISSTDKTSDTKPSPTLSPEETLRALDTVSVPIKSTPKERISELKNLEKKSKPVTANQADRQKLLEKLNTVQ